MSEKKRAILSVWDKAGIVDFAKELQSLNFEIISTGGTARILKENNIDVLSVESITQFPEMMDGRVKTLHPRVHGGLLAMRDNPEHVQQAKDNGIEWIDLVVVNLYPFEQTIAKPDVTLDDAIENIDIGGPTMLRSSAKNYKYVTVVTDPEDYSDVLQVLKEKGETSLELRQKLAAKVFKRTADYDSAIDTYLSKKFLDESVVRLSYQQGETLRYGENSHQSAQFFIDSNSEESSVAHAEVLHGKAMSYNNYVDADAAWEAVKEIKNQIGVSVIKHTNPCGFATGETPREALERAWQGDPISAFGSVIACNTTVDLDFAKFLKGKDEVHISYVIEDGQLKPQEVPSKFVEVIIAPDYTEDAFALLSKVKSLRLLKAAHIDMDKAESDTFRKITGGMLKMDRDLSIMDGLKIVTQKSMSDNQKELASFAYAACKHTKSNAIVLCRMYKPGYFQVMGMGAGQPNRVDALRKLSVRKAVENLQIEYNQEKPSVPFEEYQRAAIEEMMLASDAFFPFDDTVRTAAEFGVKYIVQPGGSMRDDDSVKACDELGMAMAFTGMRHFRH